jgi:hypothetical protein
MPMTMTERLDHARAALASYFEAKGEPLPKGLWDYQDTDCSDLIADLLHLQKRLGERGAEETIRTAMMHFEAEEDEEPHFPCAQCDQVETTPPRFDGDTAIPDLDSVCSGRCQKSRESDS